MCVLPSISRFTNLRNAYDPWAADTISDDTPSHQNYPKQILCLHHKGRLRLLAHGEQVGYTIFETPDQRQLMHLGHPEYNVGRLRGEMERDRARGDVPPPENFNPDQPQTLWRSHRNLLFQQWLWFCYQRVSLSG